jgi:large subunit ribosomal protein L9
MKVVLLEDVKNIGKKGEVKEVKDGYGMNFLIPQKKAALATGGSVKQAELDRAKQDEIAQGNQEKDESEAKKIEGQKVTLRVKAQDEKLFGALSENDIKNALISAKVELTNGKFNISEPIKTTGKHEIEVAWANNLSVKFTLVVEGEK